LVFNMDFFQGGVGGGLFLGGGGGGGGGGLNPLGTPLIEREHEARRDSNIYTPTSR